MGVTAQPKSVRHCKKEFFRDVSRIRIRWPQEVLARILNGQKQKALTAMKNDCQKRESAKSNLADVLYKKKDDTIERRWRKMGLGDRGEQTTGYLQDTGVCTVLE